MARFPRVVVSQDLIELIFPDLNECPDYLVREDDGLIFVDYVGLFRDRDSGALKDSIAGIVETLTASKIPSLREKGLWLSSYSDVILGTQLTPARFTGGKVGQPA